MALALEAPNTQHAPPCRAGSFCFFPDPPGGVPVFVSLQGQGGLFVVTCGVISALVVVVAAVADSAVSWHFRWPGGLWRPLLGLSEHTEPR